MDKWLAENPPPDCTAQESAQLAERNDRLISLQASLQDAILETLSKGKRRRPSPGRYFFGDFPAPLRLVKTHLHALIRVRRMLSRLKMAPSSVLTGRRLTRYFSCLHTWHKFGPSMREDMTEAEKEAYPLDSGTSRDPDWWGRARQVSDIQQALDSDIRFLNRRLKRKRRHLLSASIRDYVRLREEKLDSNRMKAAFASLLGKQRSHYQYDTLEMPDGLLSTDPVEIHRFFQLHYKKLFSTDPDSYVQRLGLDLPDLGSADAWESFLQDPAAMVEAYLDNPSVPNPIPRQRVEAIARAFQPPSGAAQVEAEVSAAFEAEFTFDDFRRVLNQGGDTAPGASHTTYRMLQVAPETIQREIFEHLLVFWRSAQTPDQWKEVLLNLIHKDPCGPALPKNFRPIGLIEILRKVWTKMIMQRLLPIIERNQVLQKNHYAFLPGRGTSSELLQLINVLEEVLEHGLEVDLSTADVSAAFDSCWKML